MPEVRAALLGLQRDFAGGPRGAVLDGRDTGTVVCPHADAKLFVVATVEARALRRHQELTERGEKTTYDEVLTDIRRRDERDAARAVAPLKPAPDAVLLDTTALDIEAAFQEALKIVRRA
jgi:cytidylate kinase